MSSVRSFTCIRDLITLMATHIADPTPPAKGGAMTMQEWASYVEEAVHSFDLTPEEDASVQQMIGYLWEQHAAYLVRCDATDSSAGDGKTAVDCCIMEAAAASDSSALASDTSALASDTSALASESSATGSTPTMEQLNALLQQKQTEQRTPEWYRQMSEIISASELHNLFATPYQRGKLVVAKTQPPTVRNQPLAVFSNRMSPFDWGIRFEPVVKQIYEYKYEAELKELGRLHHPEDPRCTASPDGLVYQCRVPERRGRLIEIKCPVTRKIDGTIPKEYFAQMQMQLQVTQLRHCDYVEAVFASPYNQMVQKRGPAQYSGVIALVRRAAEALMAENQWSHQFYYVYSPVNADTDWQPSDLPAGEEVVELIPWRLMQWSEQVVTRDDAWWEALRPVIHEFWKDVALARRGAYEPPESTRPRKKPKANEPCLIQFTRLEAEAGAEAGAEPEAEAE